LAVFWLPSLALGVGPLIWTGRAARLIGVDNSPATPALLRADGVRELVIAVLFLQHGTPPWLWGSSPRSAWTSPYARHCCFEGQARQHCRFAIAYAAYLGMAAIDTCTALSRNTLTHPTSTER
jgi:hypothetical protein